MDHQNNMKLHLLTLKFSGELSNLEKPFRSEYFRASLPHNRAALVIGILFYSAFSVLDVLLMPEFKSTIWLIRFAMVDPVLLVILLLSFSDSFKRYANPLMTFGSIVAGGGIIWMIIIAPPPINYSYYAGVLLVFIWTYAFLRIPFLWATLAGWVLVILYEITAIWISPTPLTTLINNNFFFLSANIIGMIACYSLEYYARRNFFLTKQTETDSERINSVNRALEQEIAERKQAEGKLEDSEKFFREITVNSSDVLFIVNAKGNITYASPSVERITGYTPDELIGKNSFELIIPEDRSRAGKDFVKALQTKEVSIPNSFRVRHKNGYEIIMEGIGKNLLDNPVVAGFVMNVRDATDRVRAEASLKEIEKRFRLITDNLRDTVWLMDMNLQTTWISPSVEQKRGYSLKELQQLSLEQHLTPQSLQMALELIEKNLAPENLNNPHKDISIKAELEFYKKDGSTLWADTVIALLRDGQGIPAGFLGLSRDTTERRAMEEALRESEKQYRLIAENTADLITVTDMNLRFTYISPSIMRTHGYTVDEAMNMPLDRLLTPQSLRDLLLYFDNEMKLEAAGFVDPGKVRILEVEEYRKNGSIIPLECSFSVQRDKESQPVGILTVSRDITLRKRAEEAIRENEKKYRLLTEKMTDIVWIADMNLQTLYVTPSILTVLGFTQEERMRQTIDQQFTPESLSFGLDAFARELALEEQGRGDAERKATLVLEYYHKDGSTRWMETTISGLRDDQGVLTGLHGVSRDVTERKKAEDALQKSEQNYRLLASYHERLNEISIIFAEASSIQDLYDRIAESLRLLTGAIAATFSVYHPATQELQLASLSIDPASSSRVSAFFGPDLFEMRMPVGAEDLKQMLDEGIGRPKNLCELSFGAVPEEISNAVMEAVGCRQIIALAFNYSGELGGTCAAYLPGDHQVAPDDALKTFMYLSGMAINRKQAEEAISRSEERYRTIFESTATANIIIAEDTTILMANSNFADLSGYTKQELEGKMSWTVFIHEDDLQKMKTYHKMRRIDAGAAPSSYEFRFFNRRGDVRDIYISISVIPDTKESIASLVDLTASKQLESQLIQAQKMESVGRLAGGVAHDFNNMLSVIIGNAEMAMKRIKSSEPAHQSLQEIMKAGMRSADLTRQLLAFARKQTVSPRVLDLNDTVTGMLKMLQRLIGENIDLGWHPGHNLWKVRIDPSQVDQLLANLTVNARDAIQKTGRITIETANKTCDGAYCADQPEWIPGDYVLLAVSDDGCGIDKATLSNIFEPFFTTKKDGQGTGLGLATVYGIVKQNNGFINVYSEQGQGTTFKIYLPRYNEENIEITEAKTETAARGGTETILIVEDEEAVLRLSQNMLEALGYKVLTAGSKDQALSLAGEYGDRIDLLLADVVMPDMNGKELSERIMAVKPGLKCLFMSGYTADVIARQGVLDEGVKFISKPFSLIDLAAKVREALG